MSKAIFKLKKSIYDLPCIHSAILSFENGCCTIDEDGKYWLVDISMMREVKIDLILRRIEEYHLRIMLEEKTTLVRQSIYEMAFGSQPL